MALTKEDFYVQELISVNELIEKFFDIFQIRNKKSIETLSPGLEKLQKEFENKYYRFSKIKRFAIPVIGRISSGKSTFLNFLTGLDDILEIGTKKTTKVICIIRHNILLEKPKIYSVKLEERNLKKDIAYNSFPKYNFEKGDEIEGDIKSIIKQKNKYILDSLDTGSKILKKEDFFILIETKIPFINKEMESYSKIFEFMDLPGLNEESDNYFKENILPVISYNVKFSFFIFDCLSLKDSDSSDIYEDYIKLFNCEMENNFYILNKIDYSENSPENELENFKKYISEKFNVKIEMNYFLTTNSELLLKEKNKYLNFDSYLEFKIKEKKDVDFGIDFLAYLKREIEKDLSIQNQINLNEINIYQDKNEEDYINLFLNDINLKINNIGFGGSLNITNYLKLREFFKKNNKIGKTNYEIRNDIRNNILLSFKNSINDFLNLKLFKNNLDELTKKIKLNDSSNDISELIDSINKKSNFEYSIEQIKKLGNIVSRLLELEPNNEFIKKIMEDYKYLLNYIEKDSKISIPFLGLYSSGKSTILNCIIGNNILPIHSDECTKRGIIIRYHYKSTPELYKTSFIKKLDYYYFEDCNNLICSGTEDIKKKLEYLNKTSAKFEDSFYILKIKIKFFDDFKFNDGLKNKIQLIDFPGLNTEYKFYEENIFNPLMNFCDGFIFINKNDLIEEKSNLGALQEIITIIESRKYSFDLNSCLFILNNFEDKNLNGVPNEKLFLEKFFLRKKKEIKGFWDSFLQSDELNLKLIEFNAKIYEKFIKFYDKLSNFQKFIQECQKTIDENKDNLSLEEYITNNYIKFFSEVEYKKCNEKTFELCEEIFNKKKNIDKNEAKNICNKYLFMINNQKKNYFYKSSKAPNFFYELKEQIFCIKNIYDINFKSIYLNYIKNLSYAFYLINLNLKGNNISREISIENLKKDINSTYDNYNKDIEDKFQRLKSDAPSAADIYIRDIDNYPDPEEEFKQVYNNIKNNFRDKFEESKKLILDCKEKFKEIKKNISSALFDFDEINFNNKIYRNFISGYHFFEHVGLCAFEAFFGTIGFFSGGIGILIAIGLHGILAAGNYFGDKIRKREVLKENMISLKKLLEIKIEGEKEKFKNTLLNMKENVIKEIELYVDSQNSEFKGIKENTHKFNDIYSSLKTILIDL